MTRARQPAERPYAAAGLGGALMWYAHSIDRTALLCGHCVVQDIVRRRVLSHPEAHSGLEHWRRLTRAGTRYRLEHWTRDAVRCDNCPRHLDDREPGPPPGPRG